jgi:hypothetical protein
MQEEANHGPRLTDEEYDKRIIELHRGLPSMPSEDQDRQVRRMALDLAIDHRLGCDFPQARRESLWAIQQRTEKRRLWFALKYPLRRLFAKRLARGDQDRTQTVFQPQGRAASGTAHRHRPVEGASKRQVAWLMSGAS